MLPQMKIAGDIEANSKHQNCVYSPVLTRILDSSRCYFSNLVLHYIFLDYTVMSNIVYTFSVHRAFSVSHYMKYSLSGVTHFRLFILTPFFTFQTMFILTRPVNFPVERNRSSWRKPRTFDRAWTDSFHISP